MMGKNITNNFTRKQRAQNYELNVCECNNQIEVIKSFPINVIIPTGMRCNFECIFCTDRNNKHKSDYSNLNFKQFLNFIDPLRGAFSVGLYGWGEPLINPQYPKMFDYVAENFDGIQIHVTTNGSLLNDEWARRFLSYKWSVLTISLNATKSSTHRMLSSRNQYDCIISNIDKIVRMRQETGKNNPYIILSFVSMIQNIEELPDFIDFSVKLGADHVLIQDLMILRKEQEQYSLFFKQDLAQKMFVVAEEKAKKYSLGLTLFSPVSYFSEQTDKVPIFCRDPWESFKVSSNGDVFLCCYSNTVMGNLLNQKFEEIWNGEKYRYYRRHVNSKNIPNECKSCSKKSFDKVLDLHKWRGVEY